MTKSAAEFIARLALFFILIILPIAALGYQFWLRPANAQIRTIDIIAAVPETGGFQPDSIRVRAGETVRLRFSSPDVVHGLAIGPGLGLDFGDLDPGEVKVVDVTFDQTGRYTLYCNTWCSPNHWRMRSTIEVVDPANPDALPANATDPVIDGLAARGVDIDAPHEAAEFPAVLPSAARGSGIMRWFEDRLPAEVRQSAWRQSNSPAQAWGLLLSAELNEAEAWDAVAFLWTAESDLVQLQIAAKLYAQNCAACHGEFGGGDGPAAAALAGQEMTDGPTAFTDPRVMLGGSSDIYYAKIRRGGMGTSMPGFGQVFTPEETWALVDYLWTLSFSEEE